MTSSVEGSASSAALTAHLVCDEPVDAVQGDAAVVADDAPAAVGVGQPGDDVRAAAGEDLGGVGVEDAVVVRLAVLGEDLFDRRVGFVAVGA